MKETEEGDRLPLYGALVVLVGLLGIVGAYFLPRSPEGRFGAFIGVGAAAISGAVALPLKQWALAKSVKAALQAMGVVFGLRLALVAGGLFFVLSRGAGPVAFTVGFFGIYFVLQWIEISFVLAEQKRRGPGN